MKTIYLDNNATTMTDPEVYEAMRPLFCEMYGNASSMHSFGGQVGRLLSDAREQVAELLGAHPDEIVFTSCGTESDATAFNAAVLSQPEKRHVVVTKVEHPAVLAAARQLEARGYDVTRLGVDGKGRLDLDELSACLRKDTALVSVMFANNETGTIFPLADIARIVKEKGVLLHTDAVQAVGKVPINLAELPVDYLALSGHKLHAPKGIGVLYVRRGTRFRPFLCGGHQESGRRAGTENAPFIVGLGKACALARTHLDEERTRVSALRDRLQQELVSAVPHVIVNGDQEHRLPNTLNIAFEFVEGEAILLRLDRLGICASSGSACTSGSLEPSHVLRAMGIPFTYAHGSIRFSLSRYTTEEEIDFVIRTMPGVIEELRAISPFRA